MNRVGRRVLVAGATGYLGGFVARGFKRRGYFVRINPNHGADLAEGCADAPCFVGFMAS